MVSYNTMVIAPKSKSCPTVYQHIIKRFVKAGTKLVKSNQKGQKTRHEIFFDNLNICRSIIDLRKMVLLV